MFKDDIPLPANIYPGVFTPCWDNIDRLEETLSGGRYFSRESMHWLSQVPQVAGDPVPEKVLPEITKSKIRSITLTASILPIYMFGRRQGHPGLRTAYVATTKEVQDPEAEPISGVLLECQTMKPVHRIWPGSPQNPQSICVVQDHCKLPAHIIAPAQKCPPLMNLEQTHVPSCSPYSLTRMLCVL
ncbi:hypothetical protein GWK47_031631 [Chionoecetes opilio]|uniref:Uncharacterized protein n=1 Tax=Chionoecetes opilio TaxID=41210 RepID=A0A8J4YQY7_CHIOP|nr:hypothetical protein GWK47_031631 [Chionoecetes opilio]